MSIIKSLSVGNGDMFYINHNSDNFTVIDCCYSDEANQQAIYGEIKPLYNAKGITRFISTHPDEDHIRGMADFDQEMTIYNFYCVENEAVKEEKTVNFEKYCTLRDSEKAFYVYKGCRRKWMNQGDDERECAGINFQWPILKNEKFIKALEEVKKGSGYNNISPIFTYSLQDNVVAMWMGDIEKDFLELVKDEIEWPEIDILFAPHHGRDSGKVPSDVLQKLNPKIIVIGEAPSEHLNYYHGYNTLKQNSAGSITFECIDDYVHIYVEKYSYTYSCNTDFLQNLNRNDLKDAFYLGSFKPKHAK
mgnify:FL=1